MWVPITSGSLKEKNYRVITEQSYKMNANAQKIMYHTGGKENNPFSGSESTMSAVLPKIKFGQNTLVGAIAPN
jgi:hypothetical protein